MIESININQKTVRRTVIMIGIAKRECEAEAGVGAEIQSQL